MYQVFVLHVSLGGLLSVVTTALVVKKQKPTLVNQSITQEIFKVA